MEDEEDFGSEFYRRWESLDPENDEFLAFDRVENKLSNRPDLHAFLMLDKLFPGNRDFVCAAEHDKIWLDVDEVQARQLTDAEIIDLQRCGVMWDDEYTCLSMFA